MADITMCESIDCPIKEACYRFMATPNECSQSYQKFKWVQKMSGVSCEAFIPLNKRK